MANLNRVYPFAHGISCPKCGSRASANPVYCTGRWGWFFYFWPKRCRVRAVEHMHVECLGCKAWHVRACADMVSEVQRETGI